MLPRLTFLRHLTMESPNYGWHFPPNLSTTGAQVDHLINVVHWFMLVLFVGWGLFFVYCLIRFRQKPGHKATYQMGHSRLPKVLEAGVVVFEVILLFGLSFPLWSTLRTGLPAEKDSLIVRVIAQQFVWNIHYPGKDGVFGRSDPKLISDGNPLGIDPKDPAGKDDIITANQLHFPVGKPVIAHISSKDVIHSFSIPVLRVKQDAIPGMSVPVWWQATGAGQFEIVCQQLCGVGHTIMKGYVTIDTPEQFAAWMAGQEAELAPAPGAAQGGPKT